jgi:hypothetical protein
MRCTSRHGEEEIAQALSQVGSSGVPRYSSILPVTGTVRCRAKSWSPGSLVSTLMKVQLEPEGAVAMILTSVIFSGDMPLGAASLACASGTAVSPRLDNPGSRFGSESASAPKAGDRAYSSRGRKSLQ